MTRRKLLENISARELREWEILYSLEPWGDKRRDILVAQLCSVLSQLLGGEEFRKQVEPDTFLLNFWQDHREDQEQAKARREWQKFKQFAAEVNKGFDDARTKTDSKD